MADRLGWLQVINHSMKSKFCFEKRLEIICPKTVQNPNLYPNMDFQLSSISRKKQLFKIVSRLVPHILVNWYNVKVLKSSWSLFNTFPSYNISKYLSWPRFIHLKTRNCSCLTRNPSAFLLFLTNHPPVGLKRIKYCFYTFWIILICYIYFSRKEQIWIATCDYCRIHRHLHIFCWFIQFYSIILCGFSWEKAFYRLLMDLNMSF